MSADQNQINTDSEKFRPFSPILIQQHYLIVICNRTFSSFIDTLYFTSRHKNTGKKTECENVLGSKRNLNLYWAELESFEEVCNQICDCEVVGGGRNLCKKSIWKRVIFKNPRLGQMRCRFGWSKGRDDRWSLCFKYSLKSIFKYCYKQTRHVLIDR